MRLKLAGADRSHGIRVSCPKRASCIVPQHCAGERSLAASCYASASYGLSDTLVDASKQYEPMWLVLDSLVGSGFMIQDVKIP